jgi:hypothetical protein
VFESDVEAKFKRGMPKAQNVYAQLKAIPRNRTGGGPQKISFVNAFALESP